MLHWRGDLNDAIHGRSWLLLLITFKSAQWRGAYWLLYNTVSAEMTLATSSKGISRLLKTSSRKNRFGTADVSFLCWDPYRIRSLNSALNFKHQNFTLNKNNLKKIRIIKPLPNSYVNDYGGPWRIWLFLICNIILKKLLCIFTWNVILILTHERDIC